MIHFRRSSSGEVLTMELKWDPELPQLLDVLISGRVIPPSVKTRVLQKPPREAAWRYTFFGFDLPMAYRVMDLFSAAGDRTYASRIYDWILIQDVKV